jgi:hypothetical protein
VKKFRPDLETEAIFRGLRKVADDVYGSLTEAALQYAWSMRIINEKSFQFYREIRTKRNLSPNQFKWKRDINRQVLAGTRSQRQQRG